MKMAEADIMHFAMWEKVLTCLEKIIRHAMIETTVDGNCPLQ